MNCNEFRKEINNFVNNNIDNDIVEDFIKHYKTCKECNEELEIYYMINKTFNADTGDGNTVSVPDSYDFKERLTKKINYYEELIYKRFKRGFLLGTFYVLIELLALGTAAYFIFLILGGNNGW